MSAFLSGIFAIMLPGTLCLPTFAEEVITLAAVESAKPAPEVLLLHVVGGNAATAKLKFNGPLEARASLHGRLFQIASGLVAPVGGEEVLGTLGFGGSTHAFLDLKCPVPEVKETTRFILQLEATLEGKRLNAGRAYVVAYPADLTERLRKVIQNLEMETGSPIALFGKLDPIRGFLQRNHIDFEDLGDDLPPEGTSKRVLIGFMSSEDWAERRETLSHNAENLVIFTKDLWSPAGVYYSCENNSVLTEIRLPMPPELDPEFQQLLIDTLSKYPASKSRQSNL